MQHTVASPVYIIIEKILCLLWPVHREPLPFLGRYAGLSDLADILLACLLLHELRHLRLCLAVELCEAHADAGGVLHELLAALLHALHAQPSCQQFPP